MSPTEQDRYRDALEPWKRKADRERKVINHVLYRDGHAEVLMIPRKEAMSMASAKHEPLW